MRNISKKKSFWKTFFNECYGMIALGAIMIYIVLSIIVGNLILPCINNGKEIEDVSGKFTLFLIKTTIGGMCLFGAIFIPEYDLTEEDFHTEARCDFFKHK